MWCLLRELTAILMLAIGQVVATVLSYYVPPGGCRNCRVNAEPAISITYLLSYVFGFAFAKCFRNKQTLYFKLVLVKDIISTLIVTMVIILTVIGSLNKADCWVSCDGMRMELPDSTRGILQERLRTAYPTIMGLTFGSLLVATLAVARFLRDGMDVYLQRDDSELRRWRIPGLRRPKRVVASV